MTEHGGTSRLILVRHCASQGQAPEAALTAEGTLAAETLADSLARFELEAVYSSPYARAVATIAPFAARMRFSVQLDDRLRERRLSEQPLPDWLDHVARSHVDINHRAPGGESLREVRARGLSALRDIASRHRCAVVVSHGQWLASVLSEIDPAFGFANWRALRNPDVFVVAWRDDAPLRFERAARERHTARAVIVADEHVLLMQMAFPWRGVPVWITPGGGIEPSETEESALSRELAEELGRRDLSISRDLGTNTLRILQGDQELHQHERYFLVRCTRFEPTAASLTSDEKGWFRGYRWWPLDEISPEARCDPFLIKLLPSL